MKLGTITVHNGYNYGASLQAYALVQALKELGYDASLVDYRTGNIEKKVNINHSRGLKKAVGYILLNGRGYEYRRKRFEDFNQMIISGKTYYQNEELKILNDIYDGFVCGSDQIWNMQITNYDPAFFLSFANKDKLTMSYAASLGEERVSDEKTKKFFVENLKNLDFISVREEDGKQIVSKLTDKPCSCVLDPVFLLNKKQWLGIAQKSVRCVPRYKYGFYYQLFNDEEMYLFAKMKAREKGVKLLRADILPVKAALNGCVSVSGKGIGPAEFVNLISNAEFVVTNSFHGTAFSVMFEKEFYVKTIKGALCGRNNRMINLLTMLGLETHFIDNGQCKYDVVDYKKVKAIIDGKRKKSEEYILNSIIGKEN